MKIKNLKAHCDIPCAVYDPYIAQFASLSLIRIVDLINELPDEISKKDDLAKLSRLVQQKEEHAAEVKDAVRVIWGDYFKGPQMEKFPEIHELTHSIMLDASKCKQNIDRDAAEDLLNKVNRFAEIFWSTKDIATELKISPNPPMLKLVMPVLSD